MWLAAAHSPTNTQLLAMTATRLQTYKRRSSPSGNKKRPAKMPPLVSQNAFANARAWRACSKPRHPWTNIARPKKEEYNPKRPMLSMTALTRGVSNEAAVNRSTNSGTSASHTRTCPGSNASKNKQMWALKVRMPKKRLCPLNVPNLHVQEGLHASMALRKRSTYEGTSAASSSGSSPGSSSGEASPSTNCDKTPTAWRSCAQQMIATNTGAK
mmetsp:Transcript_39512/g.112043  ORF Transcript_39512/g.112043 Transcript_39512/m.112043 type:complete len:213 (+) Transcript_39512:835-1473(+)